MVRSLIILGSVSVGVIIGSLTGRLWPGLIFIVCAVGIRLYASGDLNRRTSSLGNIIYRRRLHSVWPSILLCGVAVISAAWQRPYPVSFAENKLYGIIALVKERTTDTEGERYLVNLESVTIHRGLILDCRNVESYLYTSSEIVLEPGDVISFRAFLYPARRRGMDGPQYIAFDKIKVYDSRLSKNGNPIYHYEDGNLKIIGHKHNFLTRSWRWRESITVLLEKSELSSDAAQLIRALVTGKRIGIQEEHLASFRDAGVSHTLAVSGMHVGIFSGILLWLTLPLNLIRGRNMRYIIAITGAWMFTIFTGMQLSTIRSTLMLSLTALAWISGRRRDAFGALCMAAVIILIVSPSALWDPGFQLSFSCVAALCLFVVPLNPVDHKNHPVIYSCVTLMLTAIVATGVTWVISAYHFGNIPLHFLTANVILIPMLPLLMGAGIAYMLFIVCGFEVGFLAIGINYLCEKLYDFIGKFTGTSLALTPSVITVFLWLSGVFLFGISIYRYRPEVRTLPGAAPLNGGKTGSLSFHPPTFIAGCALILIALTYECLRYFHM